MRHYETANMKLLFYPKKTKSTERNYINFVSVGRRQISRWWKARRPEKKLRFLVDGEAEQQATNFIDLIKRNLFASCIVSFYFVRDLTVCSYISRRERNNWSTVYESFKSFWIKSGLPIAELCFNGPQFISNDLWMKSSLFQQIIIIHNASFQFWIRLISNNHPQAFNYIGGDWNWWPWGIDGLLTLFNYT